MKCRYCKTKLVNKLIDLGNAPLVNAFLKKNSLNKKENFYPLSLMLCNKCYLVQTRENISPKTIFKKNYPYFTSTSKSFLQHAKKFSKKIIRLLTLNKDSTVVEIACNDGYLLKNFVAKKIRCLGIEPSSSVAKVAKEKKIKVVTKFFSNSLSMAISKSYKSDLIIANNVYAHVPDVVDFTKGLKNLLKPSGTIVIEFQYVVSLIKRHQFDTIYHEHYSYYSLTSVNSILKSQNLKIYNVEKINTHGGSLRIYVCHDNYFKKINKKVKQILKEESKIVKNPKFYKNLNLKIKKIKKDLLEFLFKLKNKNQKVCAYGAAAKGNTLLNFCKINSDLIYCIFDNSRSKQGMFMPGSHIPVLGSKSIKKIKPDYILILPWNIRGEIKKQLKKYKSKIFIAVPKIKILS
jgi:2-polyprenyl-3-methyl-5-hydroxy-6-metoxy-1,4-benzoquinol methylase